MADDFDPFGPPPSIASSSPTESAVDAAYDRYIKNLEKSVSDLSDDEVMKDVLDSFLESKGEDPQSLSLPPSEKRLNLYKTLELEPPPPSEGEVTFGSRSWYNDPEQGYNLLAPPMTYEEFLKRRYGLDLGDIMAGPSADEPELYISNPGGDWLQGKLKKAQKDYQTAPLDSSRRKVGSSDVTGYFKTFLDLSPDLLKGIPGALEEEGFREGSVKLESLQKSIRERGYEPSPILIHVREDGQPFILEGNHRVSEALLSKRSTIPVEINYLRGGETADGLLSPQKIKDFYSKRLGSRPPDQSNLPAAIGAAAEASRLALPPDDKPGPKGKAFGSGIGSLMFRRMFPLIQAVQKGYEHLLTEDQRREMREFLAQPTHEFFGFEKSGLESLKEKLGISDDDIPGLGHNQGSPLVEEDPPFTVHKGGKRATKPLLDFKDDVAVSQSTIKRRLRSAKDELSDIIGMPLKRISTVASWSRVEERVQRRMDKLGKNDPLLAKRMDGLWAEIMELKPLVDPDTRFGPSWRTHPEQGPPPGEWETRWEDTVGTIDDLTRYIEGVPTKKQEGTLYEALNSLPGHIRGYTGEVLPDEYSIAKALSRLSPDAIRAADRFLKQRDGKGLLDHTFPQTRTDTIIKVDPDLPRTDPETVQNRIRNILDPGAQSYIQLVDEEPPDTTMAYGGFVVKPLYDP